MNSDVYNLKIGIQIDVCDRKKCVTFSDICFAA